LTGFSVRRGTPPSMPLQQ